MSTGAALPIVLSLTLTACAGLPHDPFRLTEDARGFSTVCLSFYDSDGNLYEREALYNENGARNATRRMRSARGEACPLGNARRIYSVDICLESPPFFFPRATYRVHADEVDLFVKRYEGRLGKCEDEVDLTG